MDECDPVTRTLVFGIFFALCTEYSEDDTDPLLAERYMVLSEVYLGKLEAAISQLPLLITPSTEAVLALILSVSRVYIFSP